MLVTGLLKCLAEVLLLIVPSVLNDLTGEDIVDIEVGIDVNEICECRCALELELSD